MLRLRSCILSHLLSSPAASSIPFSLHRLISAAAPAVSPSPSFAVKDYLVDTCGLTPAQALKASTKLSHLKSRTKPDAVLAFLAGLGLSSADVATVVAKDPRLLCAKVEGTLAPNVAGFIGLGLSRTEIVRLVSLTPLSFRCRSIVSNLPYYLSLFGSYENLLRVLKKNINLLGYDLEKVAVPKVALLRECGLGACDIASLCQNVPWLLTANLESVQTMVACSEGIGVPRGSGMFRHMLHAVAFLNEEKMAVKVDYLKNTFRWSDAEARVALCQAPMLLTRSKDMLQRTSEFLSSQVGLEPAYISRRPVMIMYSLEGWLRPRYYVVKFLKENGLLKHGASYYTAVKLTEKVFMEKFICPRKEATPHLSEDYAAACGGEVQNNFRFI
uniref:Uncharacterized protein n=1 Tax=Avena sativa TaxID=4498 RepID=A0ACD5Z8P6_AVESA